MSFQEVNNQVSFPNEEEKVLSFWKDNNIFEKSVAGRPEDKLYSFYDGPPFATGLPHYGHLLAGIIKDIIPRYWTMKGFRIERRFGWDCHGLPVEYEIDKQYNIHGRKGVQEFGIAQYNEKCRSIVQRYTAEWRHTVERIGRWVDFDNDYKTMDPSFMESVWYVFKQLWEKGLVYQSFKVLPYSTEVATPLSNFEASNNYKNLQDPSITVTFPLLDEDNTSILAWTTTPWTLPSNLALCAGKEIPYVKIHVKKDNQYYILSENRLETYFKKADQYEVVARFNGEALRGKSYQPLFPYFEDLRTQGAFCIILGEHVSDEEGTGIVHTAPGFGDEDFNICKQHQVPLVVPVDDEGKFTQEVSDYAGIHVKKADKQIIRDLKQKGLLLKQDTLEHRVPFCWRSDTPLIYKAVSTWFVKVESFREQIVANNKDTHWVPEHLRDGRFGNWLENARDWAISRNRFWGNPIPLWHNKETDDYICVGSIAELEKLTGQTISDLHRENLDDLEIPDPNGKGVYKRVPEVLDCWFESGAMPYAQAHYPFENKESFERSFPADFIAEGIDQTRGWFYTLAVLGTALFDKIPFKNVIVNGLILAEDGEKMSKRKKNYPAPDTILDTYGADALRLYLINSPVVCGEDLCFSEGEVKDVVRRVLLRWWNAYSFLVSYAMVDNWQPEANQRVSPNVLDRWILSRLQSLKLRVETEMAHYHLYNVVPALLDFIEDLTNTYIRFNRKRFWETEEKEDKQDAYHTLYEVLYTFSQVMAPFTPFMAEMTYQNLKAVQPKSKESVHLEDYPLANKELVDEVLEQTVTCMQQVIIMTRNLREQAKIKVKIPLKKLTLVHRNPEILKQLQGMESYIKEELNIREVDYSQEESQYVELSARANGRILGPKLGKKFREVAAGVQKLSSEQLFQLERGETIEIAGEAISAMEVTVYRQPRPGHSHLASNRYITLEIDPTVEREQMLEGLSREVVNRVQKLRKNANLRLDNRIVLEYQAEGDLAEAIAQNQDYIKDQVLGDKLVQSGDPQGQAKESFEIEKQKLDVALTVST